MKFKMIGGLRYEGKEYKITDNIGMVSPEALGLKSFYGGRVKHLGKTKVEGLYLCIEGTEAIDLIKFDEEPEVAYVEPEPTYSDDVPLEKKEVNPPTKAPNLPRKGTKK